MCCQWADEELLEHEAELFNCETCPIAKAIEALTIENVDAWRIFHQLSSRFLIDAKLIPALFTHLTAGMSSDEIIDLSERLAMIYQILCPPPPERS